MHVWQRTGEQKKKQHFVIHNPISGDNITEAVFIMSIIRFKTKHSFSCWWGWLKRILVIELGSYGFHSNTYPECIYCFQSKNVLPQNVYISSAGQVKEYGVFWPDILRICMNIVLKITNNHNNDVPFHFVESHTHGEWENVRRKNWMQMNGSVSWLLGWLAYRPTRAERHIV